MKKIKEKIKQYYKKRQVEKMKKLRSEFLPEAMEIIEKPISPLGHFVVIITATIVVFFVVWAVVGKMDEVVTARGKVVTVSGLQNVQTVNGGMIEKICVEEGTRVKAGQPIVYLDSSVQEITLQNTADSLKLLKFENELLELALEGNDISPYLKKEKQKERIQIVQYVLAIQKQYKTQMEELDKSVEQALIQVEIEKKTLEELANDEEYLAKQKDAEEIVSGEASEEEKNAKKIELTIEYKEKELADYEKLYIAGAIALVEVEKCREELELLKKDYEIQETRIVNEDYEETIQNYGMEHEITSATNKYDSQKSAVALAEECYEQVKKSQESLKVEYEEKLSTLIRDNKNNISTQEANEKIQAVSVGEQVLVSPVDGVVKTLDVNTVGGVLTASQSVATIVPDGTQMLAEVEILNQDIGYVQAGQETAIKLDTYNFQDYGKLDGVIVSVSPDAIWNEQKGWVYKAKVSVDSEKFQQANSDIEVAVGMEGTAEVKVKERRIVEFFLEPLVEHFDGSLKVR
ncbi:MAG: HlyD family efflux transporter periplasmic adaptor subunit [Lachnospiraceae bacterium]|nr:HlyD family efflux transporter periplasmic adaptor subunit [Lachnospiraceae bacterium]